MTDIYLILAHCCLFALLASSDGIQLVPWRVACCCQLKDLKGLTSKGKLSGMVTAGLASQICDGASAILICNEVRKLLIDPTGLFADH